MSGCSPGSSARGVNPTYWSMVAGGPAVKTALMAVVPETSGTHVVIKLDAQVTLHKSTQSSFRTSERQRPLH